MLNWILLYRMRHFLTIALFLICSLNCIAQFTYGPVINNPTTKKASQAKKESTTLSLPFWDDFSFTPGNVPLDSLWLNSGSVYVGNGIGKNPPSIGVASLDGVKADGLGYIGGSVGMTDALTSCPIDLSVLTVSDEVFLSFYYQFAGNGEIPEEEDSLRVEMLNADSVWVAVWPNGGALDRSGEFIQELIRLDSSNFFHDAFQFRFQSFGRPVGFFDLWNIDYVYLNKDRSLSDNHYPDRTISTPLSSIFNGFTSIPAKHFISSQLVDPIFELTSVDDPSDVIGQPFSSYYGFETNIWINGVNFIVKIDSAGKSIGDENPIEPLTRLPITQKGLKDTLSFIQNSDSVFIEVTSIIRATDNSFDSDYLPKYVPIDFRWNDTIRNTFILKDYYAYDDVTAELAAGLQFSGNHLAIKYPMPTNLTDTLVGVDMYFPLSKTEPAGRSVDIIVWDYNDSIPGNILYRETITILRDPKPNTFIRYQFKNIVTVSDTFLIGYRQNNEGVLGMGFDINNNSNQNVYFNLGGGWQQKQASDLQGSFMIRPVFGDSIPDITTGLDDSQQKSYTIYPNPTNGQIFIEGKYSKLNVYDLYGRLIISREAIREEETTILDLSHQPHGIYLIQLREGNKSETYKVIKR